MITFKKFLVEKIVGNTGWVYHRTKENPEGSAILTHGIKPSTNQSAMYGRGLYCCYDLNEQLKPNMEKYGAYILKGKIDLNGFAILDYEIYGLANPRGNFQEHLKQIGTNMESVQDSIPYTSRIAQNIWKKCKTNGYNGIIFTGENDGKVAVIWNRRNFIPYQYSEDNAATWKTLTPDIKSIKRPYDPEYDDDDQAITFSKILRELSRKKEIGNLKFPNSYNSKIFLKNLKKSGDIDASSATELNLPQLQTSGYIYAPNATELNLPQLRECEQINAYAAIELNLPQLQTSGGINADNVKELNLPQLQTSGYIHAFSATLINLPQLQTSGYIDAPKATELNLAQLQTSEYINAYAATELNLPQLHTSENIYADRATLINLPQLQTSGYIRAYDATELNLPQLQTSEDINAPKATELNLPQLQTSGYIRASEVTELKLPQLQTSGDIYAPKAKKIIIPKEFVSILKGVPEDCEIIHPEDTPQVKVDENTTFKKYLMLKESLVQI